ncbi:choice-of-anchor B family protein [Phytoactinopolyspora endophytica]|uniref:choice-of-anchor B family protein n=1 Tax=Phytoactinopolyspora endophytica TaxID=1642495 RepID=UPI0013EB8BA7|nr:choice-of-anchor B family protein [Phytoactinopolyspora endophytica]
MALAHDPNGIDPDALALEIVYSQGDGIETLPVAKGPFPDTENMQFLGQIAPEAMGALPIPGAFAETTAKGILNDIWGWTSPAGEEYALVGNTGGMAVVRVTDPGNPEFLGSLESQAPGDIGNLWGDVGVFGNYAYFTSEIAGSEIEVVDLSVLDGLEPAPSSDTVLPAPTSRFSTGGYMGAHNIQVNEETGFAYVAGVHLEDGAANNACGADEPARFNTLIYDLNTDPTNPDVAACLDNIGEHDFYPIVYDGPDERFQGREIVFVFDGRDRTLPAGERIGGFTEIWDATDKDNIDVLARFRTPGMVFSHQGWTTEEQDFLFINDELDELVNAGWSFTDFFAQPVDDPTNKPATGTYIIDVRELDNPVFVERFEHDTVSIDHNFIVKDDKLYQANYTSGTRVLQIERDEAGMVSLSEFGHMDTEPRLQKNILNLNQEDKFGTAFLGQWGIFPLFDSGTIVASDRNNGLIVMRLSDAPCKGIKCSK